MTARTAADRAAQPKKGDETFTWLTLGFNIRRALEIIGQRAADQTYTPGQLDSGMTVVDEKYALTDAVDLDKPVIVAQLPGRWGRLMIDGYHRTFKAAHQGREQIRAHLLTVEESRACCFTPDQWVKLEREPR